MEKKWFFSFLIFSFLFVTIVYGQNDNISKNNYFKRNRDSLPSLESGFGFELQGLAILPIETEESFPNDDNFKLNGDSKIFGFLFILKYSFNPYVQATITSGYERLIQPEIEYAPLIFGVRLLARKTVYSEYVHLGYGFHMGNLENNGYIFKTGIGFRYAIAGWFSGTAEFNYGMHNLSKVFEKDPNIKGNFFFESLGITMGFGFN